MLALVKECTGLTSIQVFIALLKRAVMLKHLVELLRQAWVVHALQLFDRLRFFQFTQVEQL